MAAGAGKYDPECEQAFNDTKAQTAVLMVIDGDRGNGFSVCSQDPMICLSLPELLTAMAKHIEDCNGKLTKQ